MRSKTLLIVVVALQCCGLSGCGDGRPARVPVSGKVLIDGQPLTVGAVRFVPEHGRPATGAIGKDGSFTLGTFEKTDGVVLGKHVVTVHASEEISNTQRRWNAPKKYQSEETSGLTQTVAGAMDSVTIEITWGGQKGPFVETLPVE
jgi:hypothetical protein